MAGITEWHIEGEWFKNCNCDPGCPCDFNQRPTKGFCEGMAAMRIAKGVTHGPIEFEVTNRHSSMAHVQHGSDLHTGAHEPKVVDKAFG